MRLHLSLLSLGTGCAVIVGACGGHNKNSGGFAPGDDGGGSGGSGGSSGGSGGSSGGLLGDGSSGDDGGMTGDPTTCAEAETSHSYIGCDYWPTVTANNVWSIFDFAAVVANAGSQTASITVTGPGNTNPPPISVPPGTLAKVYLPWVSVIKGSDTDNCGEATAFTSSVLARAAAYHLVSSVPVTVYQFSALEYAGQGGPPGKDWSTCPGDTACSNPQSPAYGQKVGCYSFSNDASLLLPSTAMTGNYRVTGHGGWTAAQIGATATITATADNTTVNFKVSSTGQIAAGGGIPLTNAGGTLTLTMNAGDVAELVSGPSDASDLSGSLIQANQPVQVITGLPCLNVPDNAPACDHIEESNLPAETLGTDYVVAQPEGPLGNAVGHVVRIYGNFDGTNLTYSPAAPPNCPTTINAGQVVDCGSPLGNVCENPQNGQPTAPCGAGNIVTTDFEIKGDHSFAVGSFSQGASLVDPSTQPPNQQGDPDQTMVVATAQFRTKYVFLAPTDYENNYVVIIAPAATTVSLDGSNVTTSPTPVGSSGFGVMRVKLTTGNAGAHVLTASNPVGIQVMGYGSYTDYTYPGGLDLKYIAPAPVN
jgi:hypothetical protein